MEMSLIIAREIDSLRLMLFSFMNSTIAYFFMKQMSEKKKTRLSCCIYHVYNCEKFICNMVLCFHCIRLYPRESMVMD